MESRAFNCEPNTSGVLQTTALQGGQCKKIRAERKKVINATGASSQIMRRVEDTSKTTQEKNKMCTGMKADGTRCQDNHMRGEDLCLGHQKLKVDGHKVKKISKGSCLVLKWFECDLKNSLQAQPC